MVLMKFFKLADYSKINVFWSDEVTSENHFCIASLMTNKSLLMYSQITYPFDDHKNSGNKLGPLLVTLTNFNPSTDK